MTILKSPIIGLLFLQRNSTILDMRQEVHVFCFFSMQVKHADNTYSNNNEFLLIRTDVPIQPGKHPVIYFKSQVYKKNEVTVIIHISLDLEGNDDLIICPPLRTTQHKQFTVLINNFLEHTCTVKTGCSIATFSILTPEQAKCIKPIKPAPLRHLLDTNTNHAIQYVKASLKMHKSEESNETYCSSTLQEAGDETQHAQIQKRTLQEMTNLQQLEQLNPQNNQKSREHFLSNFD